MLPVGFSTLTGRSIRFGNFCALRLPVVKRLIYRPELWNHLAAALIRSGFSIRAIPTKRGQRYDGESRMNFESLMVHGLGAIAVFGDVAFLRILIGAIALGAATLLGLGVVIVIRLLTDLAIPGWASSMAGFLLLILTQAVTTAIGATFLLLSNRSSSHVVPALDAPRYRLGIDDDRNELSLAAARLAPRSRLVVVAPAHAWLFSQFDAAIGHHRRYNLGRLASIAPTYLARRDGRYLDSAGMATSVMNKFVLRSRSAHPQAVNLWDRVLVPLSRRLDGLLGYRFGKTVMSVWERPLG